MDTPPTNRRFEWLTLDEDEELLWGDTPHRISLISSLVVGLPLCLVLVGIPIVVSAYLRHTNTNYVVTTTALYTKSGILSRSVQRIEFEKVQNTSYQQSMLGSYFGYGTVDVATAGTGGIEVRFRNVAAPREIQTLINDRSRDAQGNADEGEAILDEILAELRAIRRTVESDSDRLVDERDSEHFSSSSSSSPSPSRLEGTTQEEHADEKS